MTAPRRRAFLLRAGVVAGFALGTILGIAAPALAAPPATVTIENRSGTLSVAQGGTVTLNYRITVDGPGDVANIKVTPNGSGLTCASGDCNLATPWTFSGTNLSHDFSATIKASSSAALGSKQVQISADGAQTVTVDVTVNAPPPTTVVEISGTVKDSSTGEKLSDVLVVMADNGGKTYQDTTDGTGKFQFKTGGSTQIQAGTIRIAVSKDGFTSPLKSYTVAAGQSKTDISIAMTPKGAPTPTAQPSAEESLAPTGEASDLASGDASASTDAGAGLDPTSGDQSDSGGMSWLMIIAGGLLVLLGIGAIAFIMMRRRDDDDDEDDEDEDDVPVRRPQGPRVTTGYYGARPSSEPTMVARSPMAESPTTVQRPAEYGTRPQAGGWTGYGQDARPTQYSGGSAGGGTYGSPVAPTSGYAGGTYGSQGYGSPVAPTSGYGSQASGPAYGQQANGYATNGYGAGQANGYGPQGGYDGYGQQQSGYTQPGGSYSQSNGYDGYGQQQGGYSQQSGYGDPGYGQQSGGYGDSAYGQPGYGQANGYGGQQGQGAGYSQQGGYDSYGQQQGGYVPEQRGAGYDQGAYNESTQRWNGGDNGYGQQQGGYDEQSRRSDRRLDWLDD